MDGSNISFPETLLKDKKAFVESVTNYRVSTSFDILRYELLDVVEDKKETFHWESFLQYKNLRAVCREWRSFFPMDKTLPFIFSSWNTQLHSVLVYNYFRKICFPLFLYIETALKRYKHCWTAPLTYPQFQIGWSIIVEYYNLIKKSISFPENTLSSLTKNLPILHSVPPIDVLPHILNPTLQFIEDTNIKTSIRKTLPLNTILLEENYYDSRATELENYILITLDIIYTKRMSSRFYHIIILLAEKTRYDYLEGRPIDPDEEMRRVRYIPSELETSNKAAFIEFESRGRIIRKDEEWYMQETCFPYKYIKRDRAIIIKDENELDMDDEMDTDIFSFTKELVRVLSPIINFKFLL